MNDVTMLRSPAQPTATTPGMKGIDRLTPLASRYVDVDSRRHWQVNGPFCFAYATTGSQAHLRLRAGRGGIRAPKTRE
jgi:hypothetical protein